LEIIKKILRRKPKPKETATALPQLEKAILPKAEMRLKRGNY